jgi:hypothetical protein
VIDRWKRLKGCAEAPVCQFVEKNIHKNQCYVSLERWQMTMAKKRPAGHFGKA